MSSTHNGRRGKAAELLSADKQNMFDILVQFPRQVREALEIGANAPFFPSGDISNVVVLGMGGSAIGGDLLRTYLAAVAPNSFPVAVSRSYTPPPGIGERTAVIASSYSGDTEETLAAFEAARKKTNNILAITTGGKLRARAEKLGLPTIILPGGLQPRCAVGYSFFPMLMTFVHHRALGRKAGSETKSAIDELLPLIEQKAALYSKPDKNNPAFALAKQLHGTLPVFYSSSDLVDTVNLRWRGQMHENAKQLAFGNFLPEMNHNEINSWSNPAEIVGNCTIVLMRDRGEHPRVALRFEAMKKLVGRRAKRVVEVQGEGEHLLTRMFTLLYLGDWTSYYLALLNGVDPTAIPLISKLKQTLASM